MKKISIVVLLLALLLAPVFSLAASGQTAPAEKPPIKLRFYYAGFVFPGEETNPQAKFLLLSGKETVSLQLNANALSGELDYVGPQPIALFRQKVTSGGPAREDLGAIACPPDWKGALFLVIRDPANQRLPFRFFPIEYWAPSIPADHARVINLCPYSLATRVGRGRAMVAAKATSDFAFPAGADVPLIMAAQIGGQWKSVLSTSIARPEKGRMLLVAFPNPDGTPRIVAVRDLPGSPTESAVATIP